MGSNCSSNQSTAASVAKIILQDGQLEEVPCPIKVHQVLQTSSVEMSFSFVCDSDDLDFGKIVPAMDQDEDLFPGKLYFVLPVSYLKRPIRAEDMASLAVKASTALLKIPKSNGPCCRGNTPEEMVVVGNPGRYVQPQKRPMVNGPSHDGRGPRGSGSQDLLRMRTGHGYNKGRNITLRLWVVTEE